ncbi:hypothetical protein [Brevibacillus porteri]|uniref:hypothetical protein n=1 Tax=Brevibacillus porteri TaxID=2126350 RepID=UPI003643DBF9
MIEYNENDIKLYVKVFEDDSRTIDRVHLPNGKVIYNIAPDTDLVEMNEWTGNSLTVYFNELPKWVCIFYSAGLNEDGVSQIKYDILKYITDEDGNEI